MPICQAPRDGVLVAAVAEVCVLIEEALVWTKGAGSWDGVVSLVSDEWEELAVAAAAVGLCMFGCLCKLAEDTLK